MDQRYRASFAKMVELVGVMYRAGIPIEAGTDSMVGFALHRELELHVQAGIPPARVLQDATLNDAGIMGMGRHVGSITARKLCGVPLVEGGPSGNISRDRKTAPVAENRGPHRP